MIISVALQKVWPQNPELQSEPHTVIKGVDFWTPPQMYSESNFQVLGLEIYFYRVFTFLIVL